jgi:hypothetical protein
MTIPNAPRTPYLVALESGSDRPIPLTRDHLVVGRATTSGLRLDDEHVSRTHAVLRQQGGRVWVQDLGSSGGTFVNGQAVTGPHELHPGDVVSFATVQLRYAPDEMPGGETTTLPRQDTLRASHLRSDAGQPVRYDIGRQTASSISNVGRDQYHSYVQHVTQQRQSFLREIAATRTKARWLIWSGFALFVVGFGLFAAGVMGFIGQAADFGSGDSSAPVDPFGRDIAGLPSGLIGWAMAALGVLLLIVGLVLHVVATSRRRRVDREYPLAPPPGQAPHRQES